MLGNYYGVQDTQGDRITLMVFEKNSTARQSGILVDFNINEVEILVSGKYVCVVRNQGFRDGEWIGCLRGKYYLKYGMPNGKTFINECVNPYQTENYKPISAKEYTNLILK